MSQDIRWEQRFENYQLALRKLTESVDLVKRELPVQKAEHRGGYIWDEMLKEALIQRFEYTHELAWKVMKDYAIYQGSTDVGGSRDAVREAYKLKLVNDGKIWMQMIVSRNLTSHTYNEKMADQIFSDIIRFYHPALLAFESTMVKKMKGDAEDYYE